MSQQPPTRFPNEEEADRAFRAFFSQAIPSQLPPLPVVKRSVATTSTLPANIKSRLALALSILLILGVIGLMKPVRPMLPNPQFPMPSFENPSAKLRPDLKKMIDPMLK